VTVTREFAHRIAATFGSDGDEWLNALPSILEEVSEKWSLTLQAPFEDMAYNYVAPATCDDDTDVVLKVGVPNPELQTEIIALGQFKGKGAVRLLETEPNLGAMLLERLNPGEALFHLNDDEHATREAIKVMTSLHEASPDDENLPTVADWAKGLKRLRTTFKGGTGPFPRHLVELAEGILGDLLPSMDNSVLLHGDLHHWNILSAERAPWLAIDPKGVIGEVAYESGAWIRNPFPDILEWSNAREVIKRRIDQFAMDLALDRDRISGWSLVQLVLAAWWSYEEGDPDLEKWLAIAELMI
jgi:streptomycin 6-kinase